MDKILEAMECSDFEEIQDYLKERNMSNCKKGSNCCQSKKNILEAIETLGKAVHQTAIDKGWWDECVSVEPLSDLVGDVGWCFDPSRRNTGEAIALMHSELSEALEGDRVEAMSDKIPEFKAIEEEFADTIIRIVDFSHANQLRLGEAILAKMEYNKNREYKHGGKKY